MKATSIPRRPNHSAFSLIEMVLVLGIIALLVGSGIVYVVGVLGVGKETRVKADINTVTAALRTYETQNLTLPTTQQGLRALVEMPKTKPAPKSWRPMLKKTLLDPWGHEYNYVNPGKKDPSGFDLFSAGPDGKAGSEDDIGNWNL
jgi:general secretion pathway protein G